MERGLQTHEHRRRSGIPTVSVLVGDRPRCLAALRERARRADRKLLRLETTATPAEQLARALLEIPELRQRCIEQVASCVDIEPPAVERILASLPELLELKRRVEGTAAEFALLQLASPVDTEWQPLHHLLGDVSPWIVVAAPLEPKQLAQVASLCEEAPSLTAAAVVSPEQWTPIQNALRGTRCLGLLEEGLLTERFGAADEAEAKAMARIERASAGLRKAQHNKDRGAARSLAEEALYEYLELRPTTAGVFELNGSLPFKHGNRPVEVDLLSRELRVAVEVDGYYHFGSEECFRRDRRKDVLLQQHGFLVVRFLAEDINPERLHVLLKTIDDVLARRRAGECDDS